MQWQSAIKCLKIEEGPASILYGQVPRRKSQSASSFFI